MKIKDGYLLREIAGEAVVLPSGDDLDLNMMITLNDTGKFLWEKLEKGADEAALVEALLAEYDVDEARARVSVKNFISKLREHDFIAD